ITSHGKKEIYLRVIEPGGVTLYNGDKSIIVDGKKLAYTDVQTINFNNTKQTITFVYNKGSRYKPGDYKIEFYADGVKIGNGELNLKK
ncbi:MAG: hypothetical protein ACK4ND_15565, partial [Cytophagaceae bacterium]